MKILLINGSRKDKGTSHEIIVYVKKYLYEKYSSDIVVEEINLSQEHIEFSDGDLSTFINGKTNIDSEDSLSHLKRKLLSTDCIFIVSPVYLHHIPGVFKNFLDRISNIAHFFALHHKNFSVVVHSNSNGVDQTVAYIEKIFSFMGAHHSGSYTFTAIEGLTSDEKNKKFGYLCDKLIKDTKEKNFKVLAMQNNSFISMKNIVINEKYQGIQTYKHEFWNDKLEYNSYEDYIKNTSH